jgi:hypothetical protein
MPLVSWPSTATRFLQRDLRLALAFWLVSRLFVAAMTAGYFQGDCATYYRYGRLWLEGQLPYRDFGVEYPPAAVLAFVAVATAGSYARFRVAFGALGFLLDTAVFLTLLRIGHDHGDARGPWRAGLLYALATALLFPVLYVRFDLLPAAATVLAAWLLRTRAAPDVGRVAGAGALLGLGVALKLYPLLLIPLVLISLLRDRVRPVALLAGVLAAAAVVAACFLPWVLAGVAAAPLSFLRYQGERGLQVESSYASALLLVKPLLGLDLHHAFSHQAHDVVGPLAARATAVARLLQPAALLLVTALALRRRLPLVQSFAALLATAIVTANVFSPQFLLWLLPFAALVVAGRGTICTLLPVAICLLTTLVFPALYPALTGGRWPAILVLFTRNLLLAMLLLQLLIRREPRRT